MSMKKIAKASFCLAPSRPILSRKKWLVTCTQLEKSGEHAETPSHDNEFALANNTWRMAKVGVKQIKWMRIEPWNEQLLNVRPILG